MRPAVLAGLMLASLPPAGRAAPAADGDDPVHVAVFNFQMTDGPDEWRWLEKGLADQITTDFTGRAGLYVVARDRMQAVATRMRWQAELAKMDSLRYEQVRRALRLDHLVTGVYRVGGGRIEITAQVVELDGRKEVARATASGPAGEVLAIQKRLSADLLAWFQHTPAGEILPELPVWTRDVRASRTLYQGVHLYDQGRYGEAWVKFRQAGAGDPTYLEAAYWTGRMYYFMDRYAHARRCYERFVYVSGGHPRTGDAIKEYIHIREKLGADDDELLALYARFIEARGDVRVHNELGLAYPITVRSWLRTRSAQILGGMGQHRRAVLLADAAFRESPPRYRSRGYGWSFRLADQYASLHNLLTGEIVCPHGLRNIYSYRGDPRHIEFPLVDGRPQAEVTLRHPGPIVIRPSQAEGKPWYGDILMWYMVIAPPRHRFRSLVMYPLIRGEDAKMGAMLHRSSQVHSKHLPVAESRREGMRFDEVPPAGLMHLCVYVGANDHRRDPKVAYRGLRCVAEFEKLDRIGAVDVSCPSTNNYTVLVDGKLARRGSGPVGLLAPGEHEVTFRPGRSSRATTAWRTPTRKVTVKPGEVVPLSMPMPWNPDGPFAAWTNGTLVGREYGDETPCLQRIGDRPAIQADDDAVRLFWSRRGDLWQAVSRDGNSFSRPRRLPMPISSGWIERDPVCMRDETGRFLLVFRSDREGQHRTRVYACWSRDGEHWSRPSVVVNRPVDQYHVIQDRRGRLLWVDAHKRDIRLLRSRTGYRWEQFGALRSPAEVRTVRLIQMPDGTYRVVVLTRAYTADNRSYLSARASVDQIVTRDFRQFDVLPGPVAELKGVQTVSMSALADGRRLVVALFPRRCYTHDRDPLLFREGAGGKLGQGRRIPRIASTHATMAHHRRWGYMIAWHYPASDGTYHEPFSGPHFIRGPSLDPLFRR